MYFFFWHVESRILGKSTSQPAKHRHLFFSMQNVECRICLLSIKSTSQPPKGAYPSPIKPTPIISVHKKLRPIIFFVCPINLGKFRFILINLDLSRCIQIYVNKSKFIYIDLDLLRFMSINPIKSNEIMNIYKNQNKTFSCLWVVWTFITYKSRS